MSQVKPSTLGTAVITGASSGIGKVYAERLAARGYDLLLVARRANLLHEIQNDLQSRFRIRVELLVADLASSAGLEDTVKRVSTDNSITMLINNAGTSLVGQLVDAPPEALSNMVALNIVVPTTLTMTVLPGFQKRNSGTIINIGSPAGFAPHHLLPLYGPSKAYVINFTQVLQQQLKETGIRVQLVIPAVTISEIWEKAGLPLSNLDPAIIMTTENCVDAALSGLDKGELITIPPVHDDSLFRKLEAASQELMAATLTGEPAPRYGLGS